MVFLLSLLLYAELFTAQFSGLRIVDPLVGGMPISFYLRYLLLAASLLLMLLPMIGRSSVSRRDFILFAAIAFSWVYSLILGASVPRIMGESFNFILPLTVASVVSYCRLSVQRLLQVLFITCFVGGVLSLLVATKVIAVDIWSHEFGLVRTAGVIDGTLGVVGIIAAIATIGHRELVESRLIWAMGLLGALGITLFGLSRLRFAILFLFLLIYLFINFFSRNKFNNALRVVIFLSVIFALFAFLRPEIFSYLFETMTERFDTLGEDGSTAVRAQEWRLHLKLFWESHLLGQGWGIWQKFAAREGIKYLYVHNMYTGLLMHSGIILGGAYIAYLLNIFFTAIKNYRKKTSNQATHGLVVYLMFALLLLGYGAAGITQGGAMFVMCIVYASQNEELFFYEKNRNLNLSSSS